MHERFRPGWPASIVVMICLGLLVALGSWQVSRFGWKTALIAEIEKGLLSAPEELSGVASVKELEPFHPVGVSGSFLSQPILLQGSHAERNRPGSLLMQVFLDNSGRYWLVERGWIPDEAIADALSGKFNIEGEISLTAVTRPLKGRGPFTPASDFDASRIYAEDIEELDRASGASLEELALVSTSDLPSPPTWDGVPIVKTPTPNLPNNHIGYAVTWYGLACALLGVYIAFGMARAKETPS